MSEFGALSTSHMNLVIFCPRVNFVSSSTTTTTERTGMSSVSAVRVSSPFKLYHQWSNKLAILWRKRWWTYRLVTGRFEKAGSSGMICCWQCWMISLSYKTLRNSKFHFDREQSISSQRFNQRRHSPSLSFPLSISVYPLGFHKEDMNNAAPAPVIIIVHPCFPVMNNGCCTYVVRLSTALFLRDTSFIISPPSTSPSSSLPHYSHANTFLCNWSKPRFFLLFARN